MRTASSGLLRQVVLAQQAPAAASLIRGAAVALSQRIPFHGAHAFSAQAQREGGEEQQQAAAASSSSSTQQQQQQQTQQQAEQQPPSQEEASSSGAGGGAAGFGAFAAGGFKAGFGSFKEKLGGGGGGGEGGGQQAEPAGARAQRLWSAAVRDVKAAVLPRDDAVSLTKAYTGPTYQPSDEPYDGPSALAAVKREQSGFEKAWADLQSKFGHHTFFRRLQSIKLTENPVVKKGQEIADDLRDRYETSDNPMVHKVEDIKERVFGKTDAASAMTTILSRDPGFDMGRLLAGVKKDAPRVVQAFLTHDLATLGQHCGPELMERFTGIFKHFEAEGLVEDPTILFVGEVELVELKAVEDEPLVVAQFNCQQIKCTRDKFGNVIDGSPNSIQKVFYFWGLQQEANSTVLPDGRVLPPRWVIKDMMWQSMLALV
ncbi:MAG: hypothetical protein J3K34DRAFT_136258 [Monoraphidium minutum]|nr:MAG: hypothetical protein J3K34DRAFT_136258 [Monoraphidium minutum]